VVNFVKVEGSVVPFEADRNAVYTAEGKEMKVFPVSTKVDMEVPRVVEPNTMDVTLIVHDAAVVIGVKVITPVNFVESVPPRVNSPLD
jgi:hypothetical protein